MKNNWTLRWFILLGLAVLAGCPLPPTQICLQKEVLIGSIPRAKPVVRIRNRFRLKVEEVVDRRPEVQIKGCQSWDRGIFSPGKVNLLGQEATGYQINIKIPPVSFLSQIRQEVMSQVFGTGYFSSRSPSGEADFRMELELLDYYGTSFLQSKSERDADGGSLDGSGATVRRRQFLPYGFASMRISFYESRRGRLVWQKILNGVYQPNREDVRELQYRDGFGNTQYEWSSFSTSLSNSALRALKNLIKKIPLALQPVMNQFYEKELAKRTLSTKIFTICRLSRKGDFLERVIIDLPSGKVFETRFDNPSLRFSRPGEWVLDPYQGRNFLLSQSQYETLAAKLNRLGYQLIRLSDVYIYHFMGMK